MAEPLSEAEDREPDWPCRVARHRFRHSRVGRSARLRWRHLAAPRRSHRGLANHRSVAPLALVALLVTINGLPTKPLFPDVAGLAERALATAVAVVFAALLERSTPRRLLTSVYVFNSAETNDRAAMAFDPPPPRRGLTITLHASAEARVGQVARTLDKHRERWEP